MPYLKFIDKVGMLRYHKIEEKEKDCGENMNEQKKKKIKIGVITALTIAGLSIAAVTANNIVQKNITSGSVEVENINLQLQDQSGNFVKELPNWDPGDVNMIKWNVKNIGTAAIYTRNKLRIYWNEEIEDSKQVIFLYPANMSKSEIIEDCKKGESSKYAIQVDVGDVTLDDKTVKKGIEYSFFGDALNGSEMVINGTEINYNSPDFEVRTDETSPTEDNIAFNILLSPDTTFLYGGKTLTIEVITEAMQHTDDGKSEWKIVDKQTLGK